MARCAKWGQQTNECSFANADPPLSERKDGHELGQGPGKQPDTQWQKEPARDGEEGRQGQESELNASAKEPAEKEYVRALGDGSKCVS